MGKYPPRIHLGGYKPLHITSQIPTLTGVGRCLALSVALGTPITPGVRTISLATTGVLGMYQGQRLNIAQGVGNPSEDVVVSKVDPIGKTFTAEFVNSYSGTITITSRQATYFGGLVINKPGSGIVLTLSNGHPNIEPTPTEPGFGVFAINDFSASNPLSFQAYVEYGLFISVTGTVGDYTLLYDDAL